MFDIVYRRRTLLDQSGIRRICRLTIEANYGRGIGQTTPCISAREKNVPSFRRIPVAVALSLMVMGLAACKEEEQNRPFTYEKGVYGGPEDQKLSEDQRRELRRRGELQNF